MAYELIPKAVRTVSTEHRTIQTSLPVPESVSILSQLRKLEPTALANQVPVLWERATGWSVEDGYGNRWIDMTSGVLVANLGHSPEGVVEAIRRQAGESLHNYVFPTRLKADYLKRLVGLFEPWGLDGALLQTTGSEVVEVAFKVARQNHRVGRGLPASEPGVIISFTNAFHGRTLGSQLAGGVEALKSWIGPERGGYRQVPYPDGLFGTPDFDEFLGTVEEVGGSGHVSAVVFEPYQGGNVTTADRDYVRRLDGWCHASGVPLIVDEVQSGFGRTGRMWGFEHYGITPDMVCVGKAVSNSLPLSVLVLRLALCTAFGEGELSSTHAGNPLSLAAAIAVLDELQDADLASCACVRGAHLQARLRSIAETLPSSVVTGCGLVAGLHLRNRCGDPSPTEATAFVEGCFERGVLLYAPVGYGRAVVKLSPPLTISEGALEEAVGVMGEVARDLSQRRLD